MTKTIIRTGNVESFFKRGREIARLADQGKPLPEEHVLSFEEPEDMARLLTQAKLALFREIRVRPGSITDISQRLHRDRSAVKRDLDELAKAGLIQLETKLLPGHGRMKEVRAIADKVILEAELT